MSNNSRGLPLTSSRVEQIFPILTPAQINRIAVHGLVRAIQPGEVLVEQGDSIVPFFVVVSGELEVVRPSCAGETLVTIHRPGQFTGEVNMLSGRRALARMRATKPGQVIELDHQHMMALIQTDAELGEILTRAFILRRVELIARWCWRYCSCGVDAFLRYTSDQRVLDAQWTPLFLHRSRTGHRRTEVIGHFQNFCQ